MSVKLIAELRKITGVGIMDCKIALKESNNDLNKACKWLREKSKVVSLNKLERTTKQGIVCSYIHGKGTIGVLLEMNCETDFVAKTKEFRNLAKEIAMQIAAASPIYILREDVPFNIIESEKEIYKTQIIAKKINKNISDKIIKGKIEKFYSQVCLYEQTYIRDVTGREKVKDLISKLISEVGENIVIKRFIRFKLGEE
ncbi:MAG: hypothetical protein LBL53_01420 [Endomicrobium sp.]|jgi:elongation factor Ts|nr:hypothetical protein [Endomicrobium sp.]